VKRRHIDAGLSLVEALIVVAFVALVYLVLR
jgi:Tfp pilus assembly protein FimT